MDKDTVWRVIDQHKTRLAQLLDSLSADDWAHPSLCDGWTVRDVVAHLTYHHIGLGTALAGVVRARGSIDGMIHDVACQRAAQLETAELVAQLRGQVGLRRRPPVVTYLEVLTDTLVHSQDIALALDRDLPLPPDACAVAADRVRTMRWPRNPWRRLDGYRLVATDTAWCAGTGPEVHAPMAALLLVLAGRYVALPDLTGPGAPGLAHDVGEMRSA